MSGTRWGRTLLLANPSSHSGAGLEAAREAERLLRDRGDLCSSFEARLTEGPGDAERVARGAAGLDTLVVLGGDGVVHEVANGLMSLDPEERPRVALVPMGSGNDYARTLGLPVNAVRSALAALERGRTRRLDVGRVNGVHFVQTLSFGLDAAIALDTSRRRSAGTSQKGAGLFVTSGMRILSSHHDGWAYRALFDGVEGTSGDEIIFAVQVGPTYGGGFRICPKADPADGLLDVCHNLVVPPTPVALVLFGLARAGMHVGSKSLRFRQVSRLRLLFDVEPPVQADGEPVHGTEFDVSCVPGALRVICA